MFKLPDINTDDLIIYVLYLPKYYSLVSYFKTMLSDEEQYKANSFVSNVLSNNYIITHGILRYILAYHTKLDPEKITYKFNTYGKPSIQHKLHFNISHAKDYVVYAISTAHEVGIDIEYIAPIEILDLAKYTLHDDENIMLGKLSPDHQLKKFYHIWVIKEAITKLIGLGLSLDISKINTANLFDNDTCYMYIANSVEFDYYDTRDERYLRLGCITNNDVHKFKSIDYNNEKFFCYPIHINNNYVSSVVLKYNVLLPSIFIL